MGGGMPPFRRGSGGPMGGLPPLPAPPPPWLLNNRILAPDVRGHFLSLYERGVLRPGDLEPAAATFLQGLPPHAAAGVLDEFSGLDHGRWARGCGGHALKALDEDGMWWSQKLGERQTLVDVFISWCSLLPT